ncbi:hypothetical protein KGY64_05220 [Candidatus Bipolaricaulota bacterium]|nr:hypothetical protein [Candidatus Bipolaricaulota bacterium]
MSKRNVILLVALVAFGLIITGVVGYGQLQPGEKVRNLDTGEQFSTIQEAVEDGDTKFGHTLLVGFDVFEEKVHVTKDGLVVLGEDPSNRPIIRLETVKPEDGSEESFNDVTSLAYAIHLVSTGSTVKHFFADEVTSEAIADASSVGVDNATAESAAAGIYLDGSDDNNASHNYLSYIDIGPVTSYAEAITKDGDAEATAEAFGILLQNANDNILQHIGMGDVTSKAETERTTDGTATESAFSYGILLQNSNRNALKYIDVGHASATTKSIVTGTSTEITYMDYMGVELENSSYNSFWYNVVKKGEGIVIDADSSGNTLYFNSFDNIIGLNYLGDLGDENLRATLNWWGSSDGPNVDRDTEESAPYDYEGGGSLVSGPAFFSPWLGANPDSDPSEPGVQPISPLPIIVKRVGPEPTTENGNTGWLDMAIWGAGELPVVGQVIVPHGSWVVKEPMGNKVELISVEGSTCRTTLKDLEGSEITITDDNVAIGKLDGFTPRGFIIEDEVIVESGVDASTVHLHWNDIRNTINNDGSGTLDAEFNWWGDLDPSDDFEGDVDYRPFLPEEVCKFTDYMAKKDISDPRAAIASFMLEGTTCSNKLPAMMIRQYHLKPRKAEEIVDEYGCDDVRLAMKEAGDSYTSFMGELS